MHRNAAKRTCRSGISTRPRGIFRHSCCGTLCHARTPWFVRAEPPARSVARHKTPGVGHLRFLTCCSSFKTTSSESCRRIAVASRVSGACRSATIGHDPRATPCRAHPGTPNQISPSLAWSRATYWLLQEASLNDPQSSHFPSAPFHPCNRDPGRLGWDCFWRAASQGPRSSSQAKAGRIHRARDDHRRERTLGAGARQQGMGPDGLQHGADPRLLQSGRTASARVPDQNDDQLPGGTRAEERQAEAQRTGHHEPERLVPRRQGWRQLHVRAAQRASAP